MITDDKTNTVYFSGYTKKYLKTFTANITAILKNHKVDFEFLKSTKDFYCRDYMPVQVTKDKVIQFVFRPTSYFKPEDYPYFSNPLRIELDNKLTKPYYSRLILDGGNVVKGKDKVIITDKVLDDNRFQLTDAEIINELESLLEAEIIIIPALKDDDTGHADGMIRFIDDNTVLVNKLGFEEEEGWEERFLEVLNKNELQYKELPVFEDKPGSGVGIYINYLHIGKLIVVPFFDHPKEENATILKLMKEYFPTCTIESVDATELAENGGVLNCASWNILK